MPNDETVPGPLTDLLDDYSELISEGREQGELGQD